MLNLIQNLSYYMMVEVSEEFFSYKVDMFRIVG
jgi:hypothetical protein